MWADLTKMDLLWSCFPVKEDRLIHIKEKMTGVMYGETLDKTSFHQ